MTTYPFVAYDAYMPLLLDRDCRFPIIDDFLSYFRARAPPPPVQEAKPHSSEESAARLTSLPAPPRAA